MLDYHLHLWPHGRKATQATVEELAAYCDQAAAHGVSELALTEHLFRFEQADAALGGWWEDEPDLRLRAEMARYWHDHVSADLDAYVETAVAAKAAGLPVVVGMEVDYYPGRMDKVAALLDGYPFDVLLGSVHWLGAWMFDDLDSAIAVGEWDSRRVEEVWHHYTLALEELAATGAVDVLAHPDLCKVTGRRPAVPAEFYDRMAEAAASAGIAAEVSSAGWRKPAAEEYPAPPLLERFHARGVAITTASDAHQVEDVAARSGDLERIVRAAGYTELRAFSGRHPRAVPISTDPI
ncbi:MAG: histidinol-phosphatase [Acidimicrobiales bacterium]